MSCGARSRPASAGRLARAAAATLPALLLGACGGDAEPARVESPVTYVLDPSFPKPAPIALDEVTWPLFDRSTGELYLLQRSLPAVSVWTPDGELVRSWDTRELGDPHSIRIQRGPPGSTAWIWVTDMAPPRLAGDGYGHCLKRFDLAGRFAGSIGTCGPDSQGTGLDPVQFDKVTDVAFDGSGHLFVADGDLGGLNNRVLELDPDGTVLMDWSAPGGQPGDGPKEFHLPHALRVDECGRVWVADALNHRIQVIGTDGTFHGELSCFGDYGVYGLALGATRGTPLGPAAPLFVSTSPTDGQNRGTVYLFEAPMSCGAPDEIGTCAPVTSWDITLPPTQQTAMLHALSVQPDGGAIFLAELGGALPPQKWIRVTPP